jgi:branched-chain amino acid transport system permease protein
MAPAEPRFSLRSLLPYAGVIALGLIVSQLPLLKPSSHILSLSTSMVVFAIAGTGLGFLWGQSGQLSMAHAAVFGMGAYAANIAHRFFELGFIAALPFSILAGLIAGALVALPSLRTQGHYFVVLTFAVGEFVIVFMKRLDWLTGGLLGTQTQPGRQEAFGFRLSNRAEFYTLIVLMGTAMLLIVLAVMRSRWGTTLRGIRENPSLAASLGVNVTLHRILAFAISGAIAALAGQFYLYQVRFIEPNLFNANVSIIFLMVVLLGGKAWLLGPAVGAAFYFYFSELLGLPPVYNQIAFGMLLIVMILTAPDGILSLAQRGLTRLRGAQSRTAKAGAS